MKRKKRSKLVKSFYRFKVREEKTNKKLIELIEIYRMKYPCLDEKDLFFKVMSQLKVDEKNHEFSGARYFVLSFLIVIYGYIVNSIFFNTLDSTSLISSMNMQFNRLLSTQLPLFDLVIIIIILLILFIILLFIIVTPLLILIFRYDILYRKAANDTYLMIELLEERIRKLDD